MDESNRFRPADKLALHPQFGKYLAGESVYPINVEISPSGICQATCEFCWYAGGELGGHRNVMLKTERAISLIDEIAQLGVRSITWTGGGDPALHPQIGRLVERAFATGLQQGMFTNALAAPRFEPMAMSWIRVTRTDKPIKPEYVRALGTAGALGFAYNYRGPEDDDDLRATLAVAENIPACKYVQVRPALACHGATVEIDPPAFTHPLMLITRYKFDEARKRHGYATCEAYHLIPFIWEDGNVDVCAYMRKHEGYTLGNVYDDTLRNILRRAPKSVPVHEKCQVCCKLHETNKAIHSARTIEDVNFP